MQRAYWPCCRSTRIEQLLIAEVVNPISETTLTSTANNSSSEAVQLVVFSRHSSQVQVAIISMAPAQTINNSHGKSNVQARPLPGTQTRMMLMAHIMWLQVLSEPRSARPSQLAHLKTEAVGLLCRKIALDLAHKIIWAIIIAECQPTCPHFLSRNPSLMQVHSHQRILMCRLSWPKRCFTRSRKRPALIPFP